MGLSKPFRPHMLSRIRYASREELLRIAEAAIDLAYPPMFKEHGSGHIRLSDGQVRIKLQQVLETVVGE